MLFTAARDAAYGTIFFVTAHYLGQLVPTVRSLPLSPHSIDTGIPGIPATPSMNTVVVLPGILYCMSRKVFLLRPYYKKKQKNIKLEMKMGHHT